MNAKQFLINLRQMCDTFGTCANCPLYKAKAEPKVVMCLSFLKEYPKESVKIVSDFVNNRRTRQQEYLKLFPEAPLVKGVVNICPQCLKGKWVCSDVSVSCDDCKRKFWREEIK